MLSYGRLNGGVRCVGAIALLIPLAAVAAAMEVSRSKDGTLLFGIFSPKCYSILFEKGDFLHQDCLKQVISKVLGYAIIAGAFLLKAPQIAKIIAAKDVEGLSPVSFYLDVVIYQAGTIYNILLGYPISTWGENAIVLAQNIILVFLLWTYSKPPTPFPSRLSYIIAFFGLGLGSFYLPKDYWWILSVAGIPLAVASRVPQILTNLQLGHTGQLALFTLLLNFAGAIARLFTTMTETQDPYLLVGFSLSVVLNGILVVQVLLYWSATNKALAKKKA